MPFLSNVFGKKGDQSKDGDAVTAVRNLYGVPGAPAQQAGRGDGPPVPAQAPASAPAQAAAVAQAPTAAPQTTSATPGPQPTGGGESLDGSLRDLFATEAVADPHMKKLMELVPEVEAEELADDLRELARAFGVDEEEEREEEEDR